MADDGAHAWHKIDFIQDWLSKWHAVLWLDADCIAPASWSLPTHRAGQVYFFPWMKADGVKFPQTFASLWINAPESFALLNAMRSRRLVCDGPRQDTQALFQSLQAKPERQRMAGVLDRGLIHFQGDYWDKLRKLNGQSIAA